MYTRFKNKMAVISRVKWDYPIKKDLSLLLRVPNVKKNLYKVKARDYFPIADFYL